MKVLRWAFYAYIFLLVAVAGAILLLDTRHPDTLTGCEHKTKIYVRGIQSVWYCPQIEKVWVRGGWASPGPVTTPRIKVQHGSEKGE